MTTYYDGPTTPPEITEARRNLHEAVIHRMNMEFKLEDALKQEREYGAALNNLMNEGDLF